MAYAVVCLCALVVLLPKGVCGDRAGAGLDGRRRAKRHPELFSLPCVPGVAWRGVNAIVGDGYYY